MALCPKCATKKGKRYCPALDTGICPTCCATHRLETIACPRDCPHLASEVYQHQRRGARARARGRAFLDATNSLFYTNEARGFAFLVQADTYWWLNGKAPATNAEIAAALEGAALRLGAIAVPARSEPLAEFLAEIVRTGSRSQALAKNGFDARHARRALETLAEHVRGHEAGAPEASSFWKELESYFGELDFEADLDYSPAEELERASSGRPGSRTEPPGGAGVAGIIVPGT